jgi:hypothetical protein
VTSISHRLVVAWGSIEHGRRPCWAMVADADGAVPVGWGCGVFPSLFHNPVMQAFTSDPIVGIVDLFSTAFTCDEFDQRFRLSPARARSCHDLFSSSIASAANP